MSRIGTIYLLLCFLGVVLPYSQIVPWTLEHGWNVRQFIEDLTANPISTFAWADVSVSAIAFLIFQEIERRRLDMPFPWYSILSLFLVGLSLALPLFLYVREMHTKNIAEFTKIRPEG